ncbi:HORMA domain-containing protein [Plasmodiophora brassicae]|uniref:HORMA domain-containing protein n=1 Tax=Plasmodiophora brassicae TaxID=37360 RepID=A0A0G4ILK5_PLABS|nr:hypothetical protein PBRA_004700 [Plasmodiophora brassicae]
MAGGATMTAFDLYEAESVRHVRVPVQGPSLPGAAWGRVAGDLVTFVLFIREQMSAPYAQIRAIVDRELQRRSNGISQRSSQMNRHIKFANEVQSVLDAVSCLFASRRVYRLEIVIGSSLSSFRESYCMCLGDGLAGHSMIVDEDAASRASDTLSRHLIRLLISDCSDHLSAPMPKCSTFLLALCDREGTSPPGFAPKHNLRVRPRKGARSIRLRFDLVDDEEGTNHACDRIWFQSLSTISGLRGPVKSL